MTTFGKAPDRRRFDRVQGCIPALIDLPFRGQIACVVENISVGGALVSPRDEVWLPRKFKLIIPASRFETICEIRHRELGKVGVVFVTPSARAGTETWDTQPEQRGLSANQALRQRLGVSRH